MNEGALRARPKEGRESGAIFVLVAGSLLAVLACFALAFDGFRWLNGKLEQDEFAEYAALAALEEFATQGAFVPYADRVRAGTDKATRAARLNTVYGAGTAGAARTAMGPTDSFGGAAGNVLRFGTWDRTAPAGSRFRAAGPGGCAGECNAVRVVLKMTPANRIVALLAKIVGRSYFEATSEVFAYRDPVIAATSRNPYFVVGG